MKDNDYGRTCKLKEAFHSIRRFFLKPFTPEIFLLEESLKRLSKRQEANQQQLTRIFDDLDTNVRLIKELQELEFQNYNNLHHIANYILTTRTKGKKK